MRTRDFNALNDLLFKFVFGHEERKAVTLSFINATLQLEGTDAFVDLHFADRALEPEEEDGKSSMLDLLCVTNDGTQVNIEVQVQNQHNMAQRSLYYWAKLYQSSLRKSQDYSTLRKTVAINLLAYSFLPQKGFHNVYGLYDSAKSHRLTDDIELHFLELPKVRRQDLRSMRQLDKWMAFMNNKLSNEEMEELAMSEAAIGTAWDAIDDYLQDMSRRRRYEAKEKYERDYVTNMRGSREEGWKEGCKEGRKEGRKEGLRLGAQRTALNLLRMNLPMATVVTASELSEEDVRALAQEHGITVQ